MGPGKEERKEIVKDKSTGLVRTSSNMIRRGLDALTRRESSAIEKAVVKVLCVSVISKQVELIKSILEKDEQLELCEVVGFRDSAVSSYKRNDPGVVIIFASEFQHVRNERSYQADFHKYRADKIFEGEETCEDWLYTIRLLSRSFDPIPRMMVIFQNPSSGVYERHLGLMEWGRAALSSGVLSLLPYYSKTDSLQEMVLRDIRILAELDPGLPSIQFFNNRSIGKLASIPPGLIFGGCTNDLGPALGEVLLPLHENIYLEVSDPSDLSFLKDINSDTLYSLSLQNADLADLDVERIAALQILNFLNLANSKLINSHLDILKKMKSLRYIRIKNTLIDDQGLAKLQQWESLENITISTHQIGRNSIDEFIQSRKAAWEYREHNGVYTLYKDINW